MNIDAFCTPCQKDLPHSAVLDKNNELVLTCSCGHFIKTPKLAPAALQAHLQEHKKSNAGREFLNPAVVAAEAKERSDYLAALLASGVAKPSDKETVVIGTSDVGKVPI